MSDFVESDRNRNRESGRFEDKAGTKPGGGLAPKDRVYKIGGAAIPASGLEELPAWPGGVEAPSVGWEYDEHGVNVWVQFGDQMVSCWPDSFEGRVVSWDSSEHSDSDDETREAVEEYVRKLYGRAEYVVGSVEEAATTPIRDQIVTLIAGRDPQESMQKLPPSQRGARRADRALRGWVDLPAESDRDTDEYREAAMSAVQSALTDLMHWADENGVRFDVAASHAESKHDEDIDEQQGTHKA